LKKNFEKKATRIGKSLGREKKARPRKGNGGKKRSAPSTNGGGGYHWGDASEDNEKMPLKKSATRNGEWGQKGVRPRKKEANYNGKPEPSFLTRIRAMDNIYLEGPKGMSELEHLGEAMGKSGKFVGASKKAKGSLRGCEAPEKTRRVDKEQSQKTGSTSEKEGGKQR